MTSLAKDQSGIRGWHVLVAMLAFFVTVTAVNSVMIYDALSTFGGDTPDAYRAGLAYNQRIAEQAAQDRLGWTETSAFDAAKSEFRFTLKDRDGQGIDGLRVTASVGRPATDVFDHEIPLRAEGQGTYVGTLTGITEGTWLASVAASRDEGGHGDIVYRSKVRLWKQP
jgi:nitrogen fixation protein FixH